MAQVKYKHGTVRKSRHVVRNLVQAAGSMMWTIDKDDLNAKGEESYTLAKDALQRAAHLLRGRQGLSQEQQVAIMAEAWDNLSAARRAVVATSKAHKDPTSHVVNMYEAIIETIDEARQHLTSGKQFAKDRKFVPKHTRVAEVEIEQDSGEIADVETLLAEEDSGLI